MIPPLLALFSWPVVVLALFRRYRVQTALCITVIGGYLLLPERTSINLPMLPRLDKHTVSAFAAVVALFLFYRTGQTKDAATIKALPGWLPRDPIILALITLLFIGVFLTTFFNGDRISFGSRTLPGLRPYDALSAGLTTAVAILPMVLARKYLSSSQSHMILLIALCVAAFLYAFLVLFEIRMSPQLHQNFYGFRAASWKMGLRGGGFRPVVFLKHGLWLGIFLSMSTLAAFACFRVFKDSRRLIFLGIGIVLLGTLSLSKTLGAFAITLLLLPMVLFLTLRLQLLVAAAFAGVILLYPVLRGADLVPTQQIASLADKVDQTRANSLRFRLINEDILLARANQRPVVGWGGWGRARVRDEEGRNASITDGIWVIIIGEGGWLGYIARFGLLCIPTILLALRARHYKVTSATSTLSLVMTANLIDLIPNATLTPITWLVAGALIGHLEPQPQSDTQVSETNSASNGERKLRYSRMPPRPVRRTTPSPPVAPQNRRGVKND